MTWRTAAPARRQRLFVLGRHGRDDVAEVGALTVRDGGGQSDDDVEDDPQTTVRVR